jgi:hypothetical protein
LSFWLWRGKSAISESRWPDWSNRQQNTMLPIDRITKGLQREGIDFVGLKASLSLCNVKFLQNLGATCYLNILVQASRFNFLFADSEG